MSSRLFFKIIISVTAQNLIQLIMVEREGYLERKKSVYIELKLRWALDRLSKISLKKVRIVPFERSERHT